MTKTSTLIPSSVLSTTTTSEPKAEEVQLPEIDEPSVSSILNILNYSKSLKIMKSELVRTIEIVHT